MARKLIVIIMALFARPASNLEIGWSARILAANVGVADENVFITA